MTSSAPHQTSDERAEPRDEVYHRTRMTLPDRRVVPGLVVNLSPHGLMVRSDAVIASGDQVRIALPVVGTVAASVRWSLGGRIGCRLEQPIAPRDYRALLAAAGG